MPQYYLRSFIDAKEQLYVVDRPRKKFFRVPTKKVGGELYFNLINVGGTDPFAVEKALKEAEVEKLLADYGASPKGLTDVLLLTPEAKVEQRRKEHPGLAVEAIKFSSSELGAESWKFLLGAYGNDSLYIRQLVAIMRRHREGLTVDVFRQELARGRPHLDYRSSRRMDRER